MQNILQIKLTSTPREYYILDLNKSKQHFQDKQVINDLSDVPGNLSTMYLEKSFCFKQIFELEINTRADQYQQLVALFPDLSEFIS